MCACVDLRIDVGALHSMVAFAWSVYLGSRGGLIGVKILGMDGLRTYYGTIVSLKSLEI